MKLGIRADSPVTLCAMVSVAALVEEDRCGICGGMDRAEQRGSADKSVHRVLRSWLSCRTGFSSDRGFVHDEIAFVTANGVRLRAGGR